MATKYYFAVDLGATSGRTILAAYDGDKVEMHEISRFRYPMMPACGHLYWNLPLIYQSILDGLRQVDVPLTSIGIDSWGCDVAYFHADGSLSGLPYCYRDSHTDGAADRFCGRMPREEVYARTGIQFMDFNTLFQLDTIHRDSPEIIDAADSSSPTRSHTCLPAMRCANTPWRRHLRFSIPLPVISTRNCWLSSVSPATNSE